MSLAAERVDGDVDGDVEVPFAADGHDLDVLAQLRVAGAGAFLVEVAFQGQRDALGGGFGPPGGDDGGVAGDRVSEFGQVFQAARVEPGREPGPVGGGVLDAQPAGVVKTRQHRAEVAAGDVLEQLPVGDGLRR